VGIPQQASAQAPKASSMMVLMGARTPAAFRAAAEAAVNLLGVTGKIVRRIDGSSNIVVAEDVTGTNNHEQRTGPSDDARPSTTLRCDDRYPMQKEKPHFQVIPN
jgi:hypothetical protein